MTEHPLTDEICEEISLRGISITMPIERNNMRAATDWQLEQVIEWMKANLMNHDSHESYDYLYDDFSNAYIKEDELLKDLREAMRPTNTQEDN